MRNYGGLASSITPVGASETILPTATASPTVVPIASPAKPNLGAIVGGTIGGCTAITLIIILIIILRRRRNSSFEGSAALGGTRYHHGRDIVGEGFAGSPSAGGYGNDVKNWNQIYTGPVMRESDAMPSYPGMGSEQYGIVEVDGVQRPVEAPGQEGKWELRR